MKIIGVLKQARLWIAGAALVLCVWGIGKQYIRGSDRSRLVLMAVENNQGMQQTGEERYTAELVSKQGESLQSFAVDVNRSQNGRRVDLSLRDAIPAEALEKGVYLRLSYPLRANGSAVRLEQPNLSGDGEAMRLKSGQPALAIGGMRYQYDAGLPEFKKPLACLLFRSVEEREDGKFTANLYLTPENATFSTQFPEEKTVERTELTSLKKLGETGVSGDGVEVEYRYTTRFQAEALGSSGNSLELQCRLRLRYPTQIRLTESDKTESTQDMSLVFTTGSVNETKLRIAESRTAARSETVAASSTAAERVETTETQRSTEKTETSAVRRRETRASVRRTSAAATTQQTAESRPKPEESAAASTEGESSSEESSETRESERQTVRRITKPGSGRGRGGSGGRNETSPTDTLPAETKESVPESKPETAAETSEFSKPESTAENSRESTAPSEPAASSEPTETETAWDTQPDLPPNIPTDVPPPDTTYPSPLYPSTGEWWYDPNTGGNMTPGTDWIH